MDITQAKAGMALQIEQAEALMAKADAEIEAGDEDWDLDYLEANRVAIKAAKLAVASDDVQVFEFGWACWQIRMLQLDGMDSHAYAGVVAAVTAARIQRQTENN